MADSGNLTGKRISEVWLAQLKMVWSLSMRKSAVRPAPAKVVKELCPRVALAIHTPSTLAQK